MATFETCADVCKIIENTLQDISNGLYNEVELGDVTYGTAKVLNQYARTGLTDMFSGRLEQPNDANCTNVSYDIVYDIPECTPAAADCATVDFDCTVAAKSVRDCARANPTFDNCVAEEFSFSVDDFCTEQHTMSREFTKKMRTAARNMFFTYNAELVDLLTAMPAAPFGSATSTLTTPLDLKLFKEHPTDGSAIPQPVGLIAAKKQYDHMKAGSSDDMILITGSEYLNTYNYSAPLYAGNTDGADVQKGQSFGRAFYDRQIATEMVSDGVSSGASSAITFLEGSVHLLEHFIFSNTERAHMPDGRIAYAPVGIRKDVNVMKQVVDIGPFLDRTGGMPFYVDMMAIFDPCVGIAGTITIKMKKLFGLWTPPQAVFCDDYNFILNWNLTCAPFTCTEIEAL